MVGLFAPSSMHESARPASEHTIITIRALPFRSVSQASVIPALISFRI